MRKAIALTGILLILGALKAPALTITNLAVIGATNDSGNIIVRANVLGEQAYVMFTVSSTNGLSKRYFSPNATAGGGSWSNNYWDPYITGDFVVNLTAYGQSGSNATASTTATVTRVTYGTINSIKYSSLPYNANGVWSNVDTTQVKVNDLGAVSDATGVGTLKCNLLNAIATPTPGMGEEARDMAYCDTSGYKPAGTPYRFELNLHARPRNYMGMGEIKRWIWSPDDTNNAAGRGTLTVDLTSTSPWRSTYSNALQSHVGFNCKFAPTNSDMPTGTIMCTSAHYQDVRPTNAASGASARMRIGMYVNGHTGTNCYLKAFLSDDFLNQQYQITNTQQATNLLAGFIQHFDTNNTPVDSLTTVTAQFTRVEGGTNLVYDYNYDGVGDAGFEMMFYFEFQSSVAAQFGVSEGSAPLPPGSVSATKGSYQGKVYVTWTAAANATGYTVWRSATNDSSTAALAMSGITTTNYNDTNAVPSLRYYYWVKATNTSGASAFSSSDYGWRADISSGVCADYDGDGKADPALYDEVTGTWRIKLSNANYYQVVTTLNGLGGQGYASVCADYDGDGKADPAVYYEPAGRWIIMLSKTDYTVTVTLSQTLGGTGYSGMPADYDGDRLADPGVYQRERGDWKVLLSLPNYALVELSGLLGGTGYRAVAADYDGDLKGDPAIYGESNGVWAFKLSNANYITIILTQTLGGTGYLPVPADYDGDGKADPAVKSETSNEWIVMFSSGNYTPVPLTIVFE